MEKGGFEKRERVVDRLLRGETERRVSVSISGLRGMKMNMT